MSLPCETGAGAAGDSRAVMERCAVRRSAFDLARASWPTIRVGFDEFCSHLDELGYVHHLPSQLSSLYLCTACSLGCRRACQLLEERYFPALRSYLLKCRQHPDVTDELLQQVRCKLLVGPNPRIRGYRGEGSLHGWLRKVASSLAVDAVRAYGSGQRQRARLRGEAASLERCHGAAAPVPDEELDRRRCVCILQGALHQVLGQLSPEQRMLLHHYYVSELTIDELGAMYGCHRSSAARRVSRCVALVQRMLRTEVQLRLPGGVEMSGWGGVLYRKADVRELSNN